MKGADPSNLRLCGGQLKRPPGWLDLADGKTLLFWQGRAIGFDVGIMSLDDPQTTDWLF